MMCKILQNRLGLKTHLTSQQDLNYAGYVFHKKQFYILDLNPPQSPALKRRNNSNPPRVRETGDRLDTLIS